jgi:hypothetical protein
MNTEDLKVLGFRWVQPTIATLRSGTPVLIAPTAYLQSQEKRISILRDRAFLRLYCVRLLYGQPWEAVEWRESEIERFLSE